MEQEMDIFKNTIKEIKTSSNKIRINRQFYAKTVFHKACKKKHLKRNVLDKLKSLQEFNANRQHHMAVEKSTVFLSCLSRSVEKLLYTRPVFLL